MALHRPGRTLPGPTRVPRDAEWAKMWPMATAEQIKALIRCHLDGDNGRFYAVAMQMAAHAARSGHNQLATDLKVLVDEAKNGARSKVTPLVPVSRELGEVLTVAHPEVRLVDMVLEAETRRRLDRVLDENRQAHRLRARSLTPRRKLLLMGPPGSGKTMTAAALATELGVPLFTVVLEGLITKFLGETAAKLRLVFDAVHRTPGVYLFDEFDAIGGHRAQQNEVGEIRRVLSSFLQLLEQDDSTSLVVAATNNASLLDRALFRRFDDAIEYRLPDRALVVRLLQARLAPFPTEVDWAGAADEGAGLSHADLTRACDDAAKQMVLEDLPHVTTPMLVAALGERRAGATA